MAILIAAKGDSKQKLFQQKLKGGNKKNCCFIDIVEVCDATKAEE
jgi:hypothetical protein